MDPINIRETGSRFDNVPPAVNENASSEEVFAGMPLDPAKMKPPPRESLSPEASLSEVHDWCKAEFKDPKTATLEEPPTAVPSLTRTAPSLTDTECPSSPPERSQRDSRSDAARQQPLPPTWPLVTHCEDGDPSPPGQALGLGISLGTGGQEEPRPSTRPPADENEAFDRSLTLQAPYSPECRSGDDEYSPGSDEEGPLLSHSPSIGSSGPTTPGLLTRDASPRPRLTEEMEETDHEVDDDERKYHDHRLDQTSYVMGQHRGQHGHSPPQAPEDGVEGQNGHHRNGSNGHTNGHLPKRKRTDDGNDTYGDDDDDDEGLGNGRNGDKDRSMLEEAARARSGKRTVSFACPYLKYDPIRYKPCNAHLLSKISYVKQHIKRAHRMPVHCPICFETFADEEVRDGHVRRQACQKREPRQFEGVSQRQLSELSKRSDQKKSEEEQWFYIYRLVFPDSPTPRSPYVDPELSEDLVDFNDFLATGGARRVRDYVRDRLPPDMAARMDQDPSFSQDTFAHTFRDIFKDWLQVRGGTTSPEHGAHLLLVAAGRQAASASNPGPPPAGGGSA